MAILKDKIAGTISGFKNRLGLQDVDIIPGDVNKGLTGVSANFMYGNPSDNGRSYPTGQSATTSQPNYQPAQKPNQIDRGVILGAQDRPGGGGGGGGTPSGQGLFTNFNFQTPEQTGETGVIDSEFNAFNSFLGEQEGLANQQFGNTQNQITGGLENALTQLGGEQGLRTQQLDQTAAGGRQTERLNLARVNQLLQDLQQKDNARIAITGGGSTNEALSDRFARRAQSSVGDVVNEGQRFQNDVAMETERTNQFYESKKAELRSVAQNAINEARLRLDSDLSRVRNERNVAANQKAAANVDAWKNYYNTVRQAQFEIANYQTQLDMWKQQKDAVSSQAMAFQNNDIAGMDVSGVMNSFNNTQQPAIGGDMQASAQLPATRVNFGKRGQVDDEEQNLNFLA